MITTSRFCGYDKNEYGDLVVNGKEAEIGLSFDLYLMAVGNTRIASLAAGAGDAGLPEKDQKYRTGRNTEISEPVSLKRNADLPILWKAASAEAGL